MSQPLLVRVRIAALWSTHLAKLLERSAGLR